MAKKLALVFGVVFLLVGILGFINNPIVSAGGIFVVDGVHNAVHLLSGIILIIAGTKGNAAALTLKIFGAVYLLVAVLGFVGTDSVLGIIPVNAADNWLHLVLGVVILGAGFSGKNDTMAAPSMQM